jgi:hypothetical protein
VSAWPRARQPADPESTAVLAELDQLVAGLRAAGVIDNWVTGAQRTAAWVRHAGVDSVVLIRLSSYRKVLAAAAAGQREPQ